MKTTLLTPETDENAVKTAAELIRAGEVVGMRPKPCTALRRMR